MELWVLIKQAYVVVFQCSLWRSQFVRPTHAQTHQHMFTQFILECCIKAANPS